MGGSGSDHDGDFYKDLGLARHCARHPGLVHLPLPRLADRQLFRRDRHLSGHPGLYAASNRFITQLEQDIYVPSNVPELGNWDLTKAVKLNYVSSTQWSGPAFFFASKGTTIQYKFVVQQAGVAPIWETGSNRTYTVPTTGIGTVTRNWNGF